MKEVERVKPTEVRRGVWVKDWEGGKIKRRMLS